MPPYSPPLSLGHRWHFGFLLLRSSRYGRVGDGRLKVPARAHFSPRFRLPFSRGSRWIRKNRSPSSRGWCILIEILGTLLVVCSRRDISRPHVPLPALYLFSSPVYHSSSCFSSVSLQLTIWRDTRVSSRKPTRFSATVVTVTIVADFAATDITTTEVTITLTTITVIVAQQ